MHFERVTKQEKKRTNSMKLSVINLEKDNDLYSKIVGDLNEKHGGILDQFEQRLDVFCLDIAKDRQCTFYRKGDHLVFLHKNAHIDVNTFLNNLED